MRFTVLFIAVLLGLARSLKFDESVDLWRQFKETYKKSYSDGDEEIRR